MFDIHRYVSRDALSISVVAAFVLIGTKYEIEILRTEGLKRLFYECPTNLSDYDGYKAYSRISKSRGVDFDVANLAREQGLLSVLPFALFWLSSSYDAERLAFGRPRDNGTTAKISTADLITCLIARESLAKLQQKTTFAWINPYPSTFSSCTTPQRCVEVRVEAMSLLLLPPNNIDGLLSWRDAPVEGMCTKCMMVAELLHKEGRVKFWNGLPGIFGLPEWVEIDKERAEFAW